MDWWNSLTDEEREEYTRKADEARAKRVEEDKLSLLQFAHTMMHLRSLRAELDLDTNYEEMIHELFYG